MHQVLLDLFAPVAAQVATNGPGRRGGGLGGTGQATETFDHAVALDHRGNHRAGTHELDQRFEERLTLVFLVMLLEDLPRGLHELELHDLVALGLDTCEDLTGQAALHAVGLYQHQGAFRHQHLLDSISSGVPRPAYRPCSTVRILNRVRAGVRFPTVPGDDRAAGSPGRSRCP